MTCSGRLLHWGPLIALGVIFELFFASLYCIVIWIPPLSFAGVVHLGVFLTWAYLILKYFLVSAWIGPGHIPLEWKPPKEEDQKYLQFCSICNGYKAPRAHHCRQCQRCVMKMDHHCPWINNCVGHHNQKSFVLFLFFVPIGCSHAAIVMISSMMQEIYMSDNKFYQRIVSNRLLPFGVYHLIGVLFSIGLSIGVTIAVGFLLVYQLKGILYNQTGIETWILEKAERPRRPSESFIYPYNIGKWQNLRQVFQFSSNYVGDGIWWPVNPECDQYTLTREQIAQKLIKYNRTITYNIVEEYDGSYIAWRKGCKVCYSFPWTDEPRIPLSLGDHVTVTRWRKHWLYGQKISVHGQLNGVSKPENNVKVKGWFPRRCAVEIADDFEDEELKKHI